LQAPLCRTYRPVPGSQDTHQGDPKGRQKKEQRGPAPTSYLLLFSGCHEGGCRGERHRLILTLATHLRGLHPPSSAPGAPIPPPRWVKGSSSFHRSLAGPLRSNSATYPVTLISSLLCRSTVRDTRLCRSGSAPRGCWGNDGRRGTCQNAGLARRSF